MNTKRIVWFSILIAAFILAWALIYPVSNVGNAIAAQKTPVGSWTVTVTPSDGPSFVNGGVFSSDGTMTIMEASGELGLGVWEKASHASYAFTFWEFYKDGDVFVQVKISSTIQVSDDGEKYSGPFVFEVYDLDGNVLASGGGTAIGIRQHVEPMQ